MLFPDITYSSPAKSTPKEVTPLIVSAQSVWSTAAPFSYLKLFRKPAQKSE